MKLKCLGYNIMGCKVK